MAGKKNMRAAALAAGVVVAATACVLRRLDPHPLRDGGLVYTTRGPQGEPVRVLRRGGVFQSATYLGEKCLEPAVSWWWVAAGAPFRSSWPWSVRVPVLTWWR